MEWRFFIDNNEVEEPIGWQDMSVRIVRDKSWHGMFTQHSVEGLTFLCDGKDAIVSKYESEGIDAKLELKIQYRCSFTDPWENFFEGTMVVSSLKLSEGANLANVTFESNKGEMSLRNRADIEVNLNSELTQSRPPSDVTTKWVDQYFPALLDGDVLKQKIYRRYRANLVLGCVNNFLGYDATPSIFTSIAYGFISQHNPSNTYDKYSVVFPGFPMTLHVAKQDSASDLLTEFFDLNFGPAAFLRALYFRLHKEFGSEFTCSPFAFETGCLGLHMPRIIEEGTNPAPVQFNIYVGIGGATSINETPYDQVTVSGMTARLGTNIDETYFMYDDGSVNNDDGSIQAHPVEHISNLFFANEGGNYDVKIACSFKLCVCYFVFTQDTTHVNGNFHDYDYFKVSLNLKKGATILATFYDNTINSLNVSNNDQYDYTRNNGCISETIIINYSDTLTLAPNDVLSLEFDFECKGEYNRDLVFERHADFYLLVQTEKLPGECCFEVTYGDVQEVETRSIISVYPVYETLNRIVESVTDNELQVRSDFFGRPGVLPQNVSDFGCGSMLAITNGYYLRGFGIETIGNSSAPLPSCDTGISDPSGFTNVLFKKIFVTFNEIYKALDAIYAIGAGLEYINDKWWLRIENREYFYDFSTVLLTINFEDGILINYEVEVATDMVYNKFISGYEVWETESINGLFEYNTMRLWKIPIFTIKNEYKSSCPFIAGSQTIEYTRRQALSISGSQDFKFDENKFLFCISEFNENNDLNVSNGIYSIAERGVNAPVSNIKDPTDVLNWRIRPAIMARRHLRWLASSMFHAHTGTEWLTIASGNANIEAQGSDVPNTFLSSCTDWGPTIENQGLATDSLPTGYLDWILKPEYHKLKIFLSIQDYQNIIANPRGIIRLVNGSTTINCFIIELTYNPSSQEANFKLVRTLN